MSESESVAPAGQPTHMPTVRISGVEIGSDRYNDLLAQYRGVLVHFQLAQQQQVKISGQRYYQVSRDMPGARMTYQNNEGQETLTLEISTTSKGGEEAVTRERAWDFALIDFTFNPVGGGNGFMAAEFANPLTTEQKSMTTDTEPPVQGTSAWGWDQVEKPILEWADSQDIDASAIDTKLEPSDTMVRSLRVDLRSFPNQMIEIDLYGWSDNYFKAGGSGTDGDAVGQISSVSKYGNLTQDFSGLNLDAWSPSAVAACPKKFYINSALSGATDLLYATFPELLAYPLVTDPDSFSGGGPQGDLQISFGFTTGGGFAPFHWGHDDLTTSSWSDYFGTIRAASVSPADDPNAWLNRTPRTVWDFNVETLKTYEDWAVGFHKKSTIDCAVMQGPLGPDSSDGFGLTSSVPTTLNDPSTCNVALYYQVGYYVPTWAFSKTKPFKASAVCVRGGNPWTTYSVVQNDSDHGFNDTYQWEVPTQFPARPKMVDIGSGELPILSSSTTSSVKGHFGAEKVGTLKIDTKSGGVKFERV